MRAKRQQWCARGRASICIESAAASVSRLQTRAKSGARVYLASYFSVARYEPTPALPVFAPMCKARASSFEWFFAQASEIHREFHGRERLIKRPHARQKRAPESWCGTTYTLTHTHTCLPSILQRFRLRRMSVFVKDLPSAMSIYECTLLLTFYTFAPTAVRGARDAHDIATFWYCYILDSAPVDLIKK